MHGLWIGMECWFWRTFGAADQPGIVSGTELKESEE